MACSSDAMGHFAAVCDVLRIKGIEPLDALRLLMLYALRYERARPDKVGVGLRGTSTRS